MPVEYWAEELVDGFGSSGKCGNLLLLEKGADVMSMRAKSGSGFHGGAEFSDLRYLSGQPSE